MLRVASLFSQILKIFPRTEFQQAVKQHRAERHCKGFRCWDQFVAMLFCQLGQARSLREICGGLSCCVGKLQHLGVANAPSRSTLAYANKHRPWKLYETIFQQLYSKCRIEASPNRKFRFKNKLYSLDSTLIDLSLSLFPWAEYNTMKGAMKLHALLDHDGYLPAYGVITDARAHDAIVARQVELPKNSVVVVDRGYVDYLLYGLWTEQKVWFVTRERRFAAFEVLEHREVRPNTGVICDEIITLAYSVSYKRCPYPLRRIEFYDAETDKTFVFWTNHMKFAASSIARIYKERWQIELFFKTLKQNLKIKTFLGISPNAVKTQIWTALIAVLLLKYLKLKCTFGWSLSNLVAFLRWNLFSYRDLWLWLEKPYESPPLEPEAVQQKLVWS